MVEVNINKRWWLKSVTYFILFTTFEYLGSHYSYKIILFFSIDCW